MTIPALQGSLDAFRLPQVLTFLDTTHKTGTLSLRTDSREAYVFFDAGSVIYAGSNQEQFRLSAILLRKKKIDRSQFEKIDRLMRDEGGRFGQLATSQGILSDAQLRDFLKIQVSEIIYDCFVWHGGEFSFTEEMELPPYAVTISVDLGNLIMEGARRIEEWEQCLRLLPDNQVVYRVVSNPSRDGKITLTVDEWKILFLINGQRTLEDLCHDSEEEPFDVYRIVYGLYGNHLIEAVERIPYPIEDTGSRTILHRPPTPPPPPPPPPPAVSQHSSPGIPDDAMPPTSPMPTFTPPADDTIKQDKPEFDKESTVQEAPDDDTGLLVNSEAKLSYADVVKPTISQFTVTNGEAQGDVIPLVESEYLVGRQRDNSIQLNDLGVSGHHARIYRGPDGYVIEDLKSRNGVWVNGERIFHALLKEGDHVRLGATDLEYQILYDAKSTNAF